MSAQPDTATIETRIPSRLDRLPWAAWHWRIVIGLGTVWILDGLEVTIVGSISARLGEQGAGLYLNASQIGSAAACYVAGACLGALFFGQLTDRFGRKKLFLITLGVYIVATIATAFASSAAYFFIARFFTGAGIGGEYAAINSAIDELIPARVRGRVDLMINGSYWIGAALGAIAAIPLLDTSIFAADVGWRLAFGLGALLGIGILFVRRNVPESPRWLFIHGREEEAERIVDGIEEDVRDSTGQELPEARDSITVRQRRTIPFRRIAQTAFRDYPRRTILGLALFVGQAFMYNAITFDLGTLLSEFFKVAAGAVPFYIAAFAIGNFLGPFTLGRLFDTVGRRPMITSTYLMSAALAVVLGILFAGGSLGKFGFMAILIALFFFASAGASSAYLTVSEIFPMETRALAIAFFFAVGTAAGGIAGPLLFGHLINTGDPGQVAIGFYIGAAVMALGGIAALLFAVDAEQKQLEDVAEPLTAQEVGEEERPDGETAAPEEEEEAGERIAAVPAMRRAPERAAGRRFRPGPGRSLSSRGMLVSAPVDELALDREISMIARALAEHGTVERRELARLVGARYWGPGRFSAALHAAIAEGEAQAVSRQRIAPPLARSTE